MFDIYRIIIYQKISENIDPLEKLRRHFSSSTMTFFKNNKKTKFSMKTIFIDFSEVIIVFYGFFIIIYLYRKCQTLYPNLFI